MTDGERIKAARKKHGLTMSAVGKRLGVSRQAVHQWESDFHSPTLRTARRIAGALNIPLSELLRE